MFFFSVMLATCTLYLHDSTKRFIVELRPRLYDQKGRNEICGDESVSMWLWIAIKYDSNTFVNQHGCGRAIGSSPSREHRT